MASTAPSRCASSFIQVENLAKSFTTPRGTRPVLANVSLSVEKGEFVSIVGAMGSGKSTLLSLMAGLTTPDSGTVMIGGEPLREIRRDAAFVFQNYSLLPWFTALENVRLAVEAAFPEMTKDEQRQRATVTLERVGLGNAIHRRPRQLSGGMRQRVAIARAFATSPEVLFLDEPFGALDALTRETLQQELARLCTERERPVTTVMITNNVEEAILLSDRIVPMLPGPPATLGASIAVELSRPRSVAQLAHDEQATHVRGHVVAALTASLGQRAARRSPGLAERAHTKSVEMAVAEETR
jgi:nitrate/nitrite transport system ATP-binding protein